jgi:hypothetical protein
MLNSGYHLTRPLQRRLGVLEHYRNFSVPTTPEFAGDACDNALSITAREMSCKRVA